MAIKIQTPMHLSTTGNYILDVTINITQTYGSHRGREKQLHMRIYDMQYNNTIKTLWIGCPPGIKLLPLKSFASFNI
jgi:hypothetical protein